MHRPDLLEPLPETVRRHVREIHSTLTENGYECYLVGGAVRDLLLGRPAGDVDIATNARPETVQQLFRRTIPTGLQHGTVTVVLNGAGYEVTTYRAESEYSDGRHPDAVRFSDSLDEDLCRRDFTINALAYEPGTGLIEDHHGGLGDLETKLLRTIGRAEDRFFEDGLRPVRACRFTASLEFDLEAKTQAALGNSAVQKRTRLVAVERFSDELWKGFRAVRVSRMIRSLEHSGLLYLFFTERPAPTSEACLAELDIMDPAVPVLRIARWWEDLGYFSGTNLKTVGNLAKRLKFSNQHARDIEYYEHYFRFQREELKLPGENREHRARLFLSKLKEVYGDGGDAFLQSTESFPHISVTPSLLRELYARDPLIVRDLTLNGRDLMDLGLSGPAIGETLRRLLERVLAKPELNERETLLAELKKL